MQKQTIVFLFLAVIALASCKIEEAYHFNTDYSGSRTTSVDLKDYLAILPDSTNQKRSFLDTLDVKISEVLHEIKQSKGIVDASLTWAEDSTNFTIAFGFAGIGELNNALLESRNLQNKDKSKEEKNKEKYVQFTRPNKKTLIFELLPPSQADTTSKKGANLEKLFVHTYIFTFEREIKSVDHPEAQLFSEDNKVTIDSRALETSNRIVFNLK